MKALIYILVLCIAPAAYTQVAITNDASLPDPSAMIDIKSTARGLLLPRMTLSQRNAIVSPAQGLLIFQTDNLPGYYYNSGTSVSPAWALLGDLVLPYSKTAAIDGEAFRVTNSGSGRAIVGVVSSAGPGYSYGIYGGANTDLGIGVYGNASSASGANCGVKGHSGSPAGYGIFGENSSPTGINYGVFGSSRSGIGVYGEAISTTGTNYGLYGLSASATGYGLYAEASSTSGTTYGMYAKSASTSGYGVYSEGKTAFRGTTNQDLGYGIYVTCTNTTGTTRGVYSSVSSPNGFSGYFAGGRFFVNGNVGIGTVSPTVPLQVQSEGASTDIVNIKNSSNYLCRIRHNSNGSGGLYLYNGSNVNTIFLYGDGTSFINSGNLGIGTTAPSQLLDVNGGARVRGMTTGVVAGTVYRTTDGTLITGASDIRLKENIQPLQNSLSKVMQLKGVSFNWKADATKKRSIGFIAQDFEKVIPELVFTNNNDGYKGINYAEVTAVLAEAMKELNEKNELLQQENRQLKERMDKLEKMLDSNTRQK